VVRSGEEDVFHTRQQHSFKVSQVGRRLAQKCIRENQLLANKLGVHEEVVEAACLAHDLGHPPFGHIGESALDRLLTERKDKDGFEGNAQSFRIISKLSVRFAQELGLDLTRATLSACLKYPWYRERKDKKKSKKWSVYRSEKTEFEFARMFHQHEFRTTEAHLMDWADDIAYSVHDLEDFHRCRVIPWHQILHDSDRQKKIVSKALSGWFDHPKDAQTKLSDAMSSLLDVFAAFSNLFSEPYEGTRDQRQALRTLNSVLIGRYVNAAKLGDCATGLVIGEEEETEVKILKQITRDYIISNPSLMAQQHGYARVVEFLFEAISDAIDGSKPEPPGFIPHRLTYLWSIPETTPFRFSADCIASLTEREALALYARLSGAASGSVLDPIVR
jgi:dGTPase